MSKRPCLHFASAEFEDAIPCERPTPKQRREREASARPRGRPEAKKRVGDAATAS